MRSEDPHSNPSLRGMSDEENPNARCLLELSTAGVAVVVAALALLALLLVLVQAVLNVARGESMRRLRGRDVTATMLERC